MQLRNLKLFLQKVSIWIDMQNKSKVPQLHSIGEKKNLLIASYHRTFLQNYGTEEHEIFLQRVSIWVDTENKFQVPRLHSIGEKFDANL